MSARKFAYRKCEAIMQAPAPFHPISPRRAGPQFLTQAHLPLNLQSEIYVDEGIDLNVSTLTRLGRRLGGDADAQARTIDPRFGET
jgi:transposase